MTKILKRLEEQGFIRRTPDPDDGRGSRVHLTKAGLELQDRVFGAFLSASQDLFAALPAARRRDLDRALRTLVKAFAAYVAG
jgi:DNA-binding MarR family transcriptional regulator